MKRPLWLAVIALGLAPAVRADDPCAQEVSRLCPRGRGDLQMVGCLRRHEPELSQACKGDLDEVLAKARSISADCEGDVYALCKDVQPGEGRVAECLKQNESHLSQSCQKAFNTWRLQRMEITSACAGDVGNFCKDVPQGGGRIWTCLKKHRKDLSSDCRSAMDKL
jgi:DNA-binding transcriptional regulator YdaS (Cro superfamily)